MSTGGWRRWLVTCGGAGMSPVAPGTAGSIATTALLYGIYLLLARGADSADPVLWHITLLAGLLATCGLSVWLGPWAGRYYGRKDPSPFVLDEVAGICVAMLFQPMLGGAGQVWVMLAAMLAFRLFDIWKPPPARQLERLPDGWGILLDDLAAGVYANLLCQVILRGIMRWP